MRPQTEAERIASRYIPKESLPVNDPAGRGVVYVYQYGPEEKPKYAAMAYAGTAGKAAYHHNYRNPEQRREEIGRFFRGLAEQEKMVTERRAQDFSGHSFVVGDIVTNSWGYDQTNVDWYRVAKASKNYVWLMPVCSTLETDRTGAGPMSGNVALSLDEDLKPVDAKDGKLTKHRASRESVTMRHGCGSKYTGGTLYESWYA